MPTGTEAREANQKGEGRCNLGTRRHVKELSIFSLDGKIKENGRFNQIPVLKGLHCGGRKGSVLNNSRVQNLYKVPSQYLELSKCSIDPFSFCSLFCSLPIKTCKEKLSTTNSNILEAVGTFKWLDFGQWY